MKLNLTRLSGKQLKQEKLAQQVEGKIVERLTEILKPEQVLTLSQMTENDDPSLENFLKENCPDFDKIVDEEINRANQDKR